MEAFGYFLMLHFFWVDCLIRLNLISCNRIVSQLATDPGLASPLEGGGGGEGGGKDGILIGC